MYYGPSRRLTIVSKVITPASSHDMTDLATVKGELNISDTSGDSVLTRYITAASSAVEQFCNRVLVAETVQDSVFPQRDPPVSAVEGGLDKLQLSRWPLITIVSVVENGTTLVENTDFIADYDSGALTRLDANGLPMRWSTLPVVLQFEAGYSTIPADVADAVIRTVAQRWFARGRDPMLRGEKVVGVSELNYWVATGSSKGTEDNLSPDVQSLLDNYRVPVLA